MQQLNENTWTVASSKGGMTYIVKRNEDSSWSCTCKSFEINEARGDAICKHIAAVKMEVRERGKS